MMILPLADALQNCLQNLTSRIAGVDNEQMTSRVMGMGAMLGFGVSTIKEQFKTPSSNSTGKIGNSNNGGSTDGLKGFVSRAKSVINPSGLSLSVEKDYNGNINPIRDNLKTSKILNTGSPSIESGNGKTTNDGTNSKLSNGISKAKNIAGGVTKAGYGATKVYLKAGASMAEGNFNMNNNSFKQNKKNNNYKKDFQNTEYANNISKLVKPPLEGGGEDEHSG